jgi:hypothetical protein
VIVLLIEECRNIGRPYSRSTTIERALKVPHVARRIVSRRNRVQREFVVVVTVGPRRTDAGGSERERPEGVQE